MPLTYRLRKAFMMLATALLLVSCNNLAEVSVFNNSDVDREGELVELCLCSFKRVDPAKLVVLDSSGNQLPVQLVYRGEVEPQAFVFPVSLKAGEKALYTVKEGEPATVAVKTFVRQVPERKDDVAWENDRIAFRAYGPALANENPSNGFDVWYKRTNNLIIDKWYKDDLAGVASYHDDHGEGLDCYKVAHTLGAGAIAPYTTDSVWVYGHYDRFKVLDKGPLRSSFVLYYDSVPYDGHTLKAEIQVTLDAGSNLNEICARFMGDTAQIRLAAGIFLHDTVGVIHGHAEKGFVGYAENTMSQGKVASYQGRGYTGMVFLGRLAEVVQVDQHVLGITHYQQGEVYRYFAGAGWEKGGFPTDQDWFAYLANQYKAKTNPLDVKILK